MIKLSKEDEKSAKELAGLFSTDVLSRALSLRRGREGREAARTPIMRHLLRDERVTLRMDEYMFSMIGKESPAPYHKCVPECGMYTEKELQALFDREFAPQSERIRKQQKETLRKVDPKGTA